ncbi:MAG: hypothetical protein D6732_13370 [Methanobacteriota archaeon]|nr:MAG: hypothetical protein D6732_13370 [Euryarchaeota archaeon]
MLTKLSIRLIIGVLTPILFEVSLIFLYSSIKYDTIDFRAVLGGIVLFFWVVALYVISPFVLVKFGKFEKRFGAIIREGLHQALITGENTATSDPTQSSLSLDLNVAKAEQEIVMKSIEENLIPQLAKSSVNFYTDTFYARDYTKSNRTAIMNLEYYESIALLSLFTMFFLLLDFLLLFIMKFTSIDFIFITLDQISNWGFFFTLTFYFVVSFLVMFIAFRHSLPFIDEYVSYTIPIMFRESEMSSFIRRESIRSIVSYNFDNLISRKEQKRAKDVIESTMDHLLHDLLEDELMISSRRKLALKLAWREYSKLLSAKVEEREKKGKHRYLDRLLLGERIGSMQIDESELLGLNSDLSFIRDQLNRWGKLNSAQRTVIFLSLYRITERIIKEAVSVFVDLEENPLNFYEQTRYLLEKDLISVSAYDKINEFRYTRNKLIHEPGVSINVASNTITQVLSALNQLVGNISKLPVEPEPELV